MAENKIRTGTVLVDDLVEERLDRELLGEIDSAHLTAQIVISPTQVGISVQLSGKRAAKVIAAILFLMFVEFLKRHLT